MERLTKYDTDGQAMMDCQKCEADWTGKHGKPMADCTALYCRNRLLDRLVKYEDTERTPEEIDMDHEAAETLRQLCQNCDLDRLEKLAEADRAGRLTGTTPATSLPGALTFRRPVPRMRTSLPKSVTKGPKPSR